MNTFLYNVALDLFNRFGNDLRKVTVVFPGKRAQLFMNQHLTDISQEPIWAPRYTTIDRLLGQFSEYTPADPLRTICLLYRIYSKHVPSPMDIDDFYGWGETLLHDFEDIDKHMVQAEALFANATDLYQLEQNDFLTEEQVEVLKHFFMNFSQEKSSSIKQRFLDLWEAMPSIYTELKEELQKKGTLYTAALNRKVAEKAKEGIKLEDSEQIYAFVGFNILDETEETFFSAMQKTGQALFYWDYDGWYVTDEGNEAGLFMRKNLEKFPNSLTGLKTDNMLSNGKELRFIATSTDNAMARYVHTWIGDKYIPEHPSECAAVLCDEALMRPVLHSIPDIACNVTMGYPLTDTPIFSYFSALIDLQIDGFDQQMQVFRKSHLDRLKNHPLFASYKATPIDNLTICNNGSELLKWLTHSMEDLGRYYSNLQNQEDAYIQLYTEATFLIYTQLNIFTSMITERLLLVSNNTLRRLITQSLSRQSIPFHGEMTQGMQIMGLLETRNIDFKHIIVLSAGEGFLPKNADEISLIPYYLRQYFHLSTIERKTSVFAYYFYRLLQRAEDITVLYNENSSGATQREESRFLRQLLAETNLPIKTIRLSANVALHEKKQIETIEKTEKVMEQLLNTFDLQREKEGKPVRTLSPTAINTYINCPLLFYYQYVCNICDPEPEDDIIDNRILGNIFHETAEHIYKDLAQKENGLITQEMLNGLLESDGLQLKQYILKHMNTQGRLTGIHKIVFDVVLRYMTQLLSDDLQLVPFKMLGEELRCEKKLEIECNGTKCQIKLGGIIDRLDQVELNGHETIRIIDYKTGKANNSTSSLEGVFDGKHGQYLQAMLYSAIISEEEKLPIAPGLYNLMEASKKASNYLPYLKIGKEDLYDIRSYYEEYMQNLKEKISDIFNKDLPFQRAKEDDNCKYCKLKDLCVR